MISFPVSSPAFCIDTITFYFSHYKFVLKFIVFLIYIFLIGSDVEYFSYAYFMFVYLMEYLFMYFAYFLIGLFVFKLLSFKNYLYVLNTNPLSDMWFSDILAHSVDFLFSFFFNPNRAFDRASLSNFDEVQLINLYFYELCFWCQV